MSPSPPEAPRLILASASPRRRELIALLGAAFDVVPSRYEESLPRTHADPAALATQLAVQKARDVTGSCCGALVIGADTIVLLGERVFGKPADAVDASGMLRELSGRTHTVVTGVAVVDTRRSPPETHCFASSADVTFRPLCDSEIAAYVEGGEPMDKAGAYGIQGQGALLIQSIHGDYPTVMGLPIARLALLLRRLGVTILGRAGSEPEDLAAAAEH